MRSQHIILSSLGLGLLCMASCGASGESATVSADAGTDAMDVSAEGPLPDGDVSPSADTEPGSVVNPCPSGQVLGGLGACIPVGIQGCASEFIDPATGLCDPSPDDCPVGHFPIFNEGCLSASIPGCVEAFMNPETGLCDPQPEACSPGEIPVFDDGCRKVGIVDCHPDFIDPVTGHCDPDPDACDPYHIPVPTQGCVSLDPPGGCGTGTWGLVELLDGDVHVDIDYDGADSDGSRDKPFIVIKDATDAVQDGGRVVLAAGDYPEGVRIKKSVALVGRCSSMVTLSGVKATTQDFEAVLRVNGVVDASIQDLTVSGPGVGLLVYGGASLTASRVAWIANLQTALLAVEDGTEVALSDVLISQTQALANGFGGVGIDVEYGAVVTLNRGALVDNRVTGLLVRNSGSSASVSDVTIARTQPLSTGFGGAGVGVEDTATLTLADAAVIENHDTGIYAIDEGTSADLSRVLVARTQQHPAGTLGSGLAVQDGADVTLSHGAVVDNHENGIFVGTVGTSLDASDLLVARTQHNANGRSGSGIAIGYGATLSLARAALVENHEVGLSVDGTGTSATVSDIVVARTQWNGLGEVGHGVDVVAGASLTVARAAVVENVEAGFFAADPGTTLEVTDVLAARNQPDGSGHGGRGVAATEGAMVTITRGAVVDNHQFGLTVEKGGTVMTLSDLLIARTQPDGLGEYCHGVGARGGPILRLTRSALVENCGVGLLGSDPGTALDLSDLLIARTRPRDDAQFGLGLVLIGGASMAMTRSALVDNVFAGMWIGQAGGSVSETLVSGTDINNDSSFGDGMLVIDSTVNTTRVVARDNARTGFLYSDSMGTLSECYAVGNVIGFASNLITLIEGPQFTDDSLAEDNAQDISTEGDLAVPSEPMEIPEFPVLD